ncbi:MAG: hypothetical protein LBQ24_06725 [Candidatus Peribacteria bacterium]|jgi:hypothetical protein|nr:hypothetical protein [Candidatus Peribacteria bacterium]
MLVHKILYAFKISIQELESILDKSKAVSQVIFFISAKEAFLYFGIINNKNSGSIFFTQIDIFVCFLISCRYFENQDTFESLK